jgi:alpha-aminoadipate/glutamate carrier protein LysW
MAQCPECEAVLDMDLEDVEEGQLVSCPECGVDLEVVNINPVELDLADDEELDEEDEDEELEDEDELDYEEDEDTDEEEEDDYDE